MDKWNPKKKLYLLWIINHRLLTTTSDGYVEIIINNFDRTHNCYKCVCGYRVWHNEQIKWSKNGPKRFDKSVFLCDTNVIPIYVIASVITREKEFWRYWLSLIYLFFYEHRFFKQYSSRVCCLFYLCAEFRNSVNILIIFVRDEYAKKSYVGFSFDFHIQNCSFERYIEQCSFEWSGKLSVGESRRYNTCIFFNWISVSIIKKSLILSLIERWIWMWWQLIIILFLSLLMSWSLLIFIFSMHSRFVLLLMLTQDCG